jgi:hypothetical protein
VLNVVWRLLKWQQFSPLTTVLAATGFAVVITDGMVHRIESTYNAVGELSATHPFSSRQLFPHMFLC